MWIFDLQAVKIKWREGRLVKVTAGREILKRNN